MKNILDFRQISAKFYLWLTDTRGVTAIETGVVLSFASAIAGSAGVLFGDDLSGMFEHLNSALQNPVSLNADSGFSMAAAGNPDQIAH